MEISSQAFSFAGMLFLLVGGVAGWLVQRSGQEKARWIWWRAALVGVGAWLVSVILRVITTVQDARGWLPLTNPDDRSVCVGLLAGLLTISPIWRRSLLVRRRTNGSPGAELGWASLILVAVLVRIRITVGTAGMDVAPGLSLCVAIAAALALWSAGQALDVLTRRRRDNRRAAAWALGGLTVACLVVAGANEWLWGAATGAGSTWLVLVAAWLAAAARLTWQRRTVGYTGVLDVLIAALLVGAALNARWVLPFS